MLRTVLLTIQLLIALGLIAVILLQSGHSAGLGAVAGGAESFFGKKKGFDVLLGKMTTGFAFGLFVIALVLAVV